MLKQYDEHERGNGSKYDEIEQKAMMMISCIENHSFNQGRLLQNSGTKVHQRGARYLRQGARYFTREPVICAAPPCDDCRNC